MAIRNPHDVVHDVAYESMCGPQSDGDPASVITADRLAIVELVRSRLLALADDLTNDEAYALETAIEAVHAAAASKGTNDDG